MTFLDKKDFFDYRYKPIYALAWIFLLMNSVTIMMMPRPQPHSHLGVAVIFLITSFVISGFCALVGSLLYLPGPTNSHRKLIRSWRKITHLPLSAIPLDDSERVAMTPCMEKILKEYAITANSAIAHRKIAQTVLNTITASLPVGSLAVTFRPENLKAFRKNRAKALCNLKYITKVADRRHKKYLAAWDFFVKECRDSESGFLSHLKSQGPEAWRENCSS